MKYKASNPTDINVYFPLSKRTLIAGESGKIVEYSGARDNLEALGLIVEPLGAGEVKPRTGDKHRRGKR